MERPALELDSESALLEQELASLAPGPELEGQVERQRRVLASVLVQG